MTLMHTSVTKILFYSIILFDFTVQPMIH